MLLNRKDGMLSQGRRVVVDVVECIMHRRLWRSPESIQVTACALRCLLTLALRHTWDDDSLPIQKPAATNSWARLLVSLLIQYRVMVSSDSVVEK